MQKRKALVAAALTGVFLAGTISTASAERWHHYRDYRGGYYHRGPGPVLGLLGAVVVGAATIATAPIAILANAGRSPEYNGPQQRGYYGPPPQAYGPSNQAYGPGDYEDAPPPPPPPGYYRRNYGPPPGYYGGY